MKAYIGVCLIMLTLMVRVSAQGPSIVVTSKELTDTSAPGWVWNAMDAYEDNQLSRGAGRAGGPGGYGAYTFNGTGVAVYVMKAPAVEVDGRVHKVGRLRVLIDGNLKAAVAVSSNDHEYGYRAYAVNGLSAANHVLQLEPDAGWVVVDGIRVIGGPEAPDVSQDGAVGPNPTKVGPPQQILFYGKTQPLVSENTMLFRNSVAGFLNSLNPELVVANLPGDWGPEQVYPRSGTSAIRYSGSSLGGDAYCGMAAYAAHASVTKNTVLTYWILPQQDNGRFVAVDLHCTDGTTLSQTAATDQNGVSVAPGAGHGGRLPTYMWSPVQCIIGNYLAGKTIDAIWIVFARNAAAGGQYRGYIDEITLYNE